MISEHAKSNLSLPTAAEFAVLQILWRRGACTVRKVHDILQTGNSSTAYTTTLKTMQIMYKKQLLYRDDRQKAHIFRAQCTALETRKLFLKDLLEKVFHGSSYQMLELMLQVSDPLDQSEIKLLQEQIELNQVDYNKIKEMG
ncbi:MAG: BlaI/MecI/CopY family transcriptional regulator [bacterium]